MKRITLTEQEITDRSADKLQQGYDGPSPRRLTVLYQSALLAVAALSLIGQALVQWQLIRQQSDAHVVNLAGRERMLSQRISKEALAWQTAANSTERGKRLQNLQESLQQWERNYLMLKNNEGYLADSTPNSRAVKSLFLQADQPFNFLRDAAHQLIEHSLAMPANTDESLADADLIKRRILQHEPEFLRLMDAIVDQYEIEATARVNTLRGFELLLLFLTLSVLAAEGLWIFRPAIGNSEPALPQSIEHKRNYKRRGMLPNAPIKPRRFFWRV